MGWEGSWWEKYQGEPSSWAAPGGFPPVPSLLSQNELKGLEIAKDL